MWLNQKKLFLVACLGIFGLTACSTSGQSGPLDFGNDEGTVDSRLCGPNALKSTDIFYGHTATNTSNSDLELVDLALINPSNVAEETDLAMVIQEGKSDVFYFHFENPMDDEESNVASLIDQMLPAQGFSIPANTSVIFTVKANIQNVDLETSVSQMEVQYKEGGKVFTERNSMSWATQPSECN